MNEVHTKISQSKNTTESTLLSMSIVKIIFRKPRLGEQFESITEEVGKNQNKGK